MSNADKINRLENEIEILKWEDKLRSKLGDNKYGMEYGEFYYYIPDYGQIIYRPWTESTIDVARFEMGNVFKTPEQAQAQLEKLKLGRKIK